MTIAKHMGSAKHCAADQSRSVESKRFPPGRVVVVETDEQTQAEHLRCENAWHGISNGFQWHQKSGRGAEGHAKGYVELHVDVLPNATFPPSAIACLGWNKVLTKAIHGISVARILSQPDILQVAMVFQLMNPPHTPHFHTLQAGGAPGGWRLKIKVRGLHSASHGRNRNLGADCWDCLWAGPDPRSLLRH